MLYLKKLNTGGCVLTCNGKSYRYDTLGNFDTELKFTSSNLVGGGWVNAVSILASNNTIDLGVLIDSTFRSFYIEGIEVDALYKALYDEKEFILFLIKSGRQDEVSFMQYLYIYTKQINILGKLEKLANRYNFKIYINK